MQLWYSKDMSVHVLTCTSCAEVVAVIQCVFVCLVTKMSDWFLEQQINIKLCVKLQKNARNICVILSEAYGEEAIKKVKCF